MTKEKGPEFGQGPVDELSRLANTGPQQDQFFYNWMYSFMPANDEIYLVGYDKGTNRVFAVEIPRNTDGSVRITNVNVPKNYFRDRDTGAEQ